jgi:uncharacterized protein YjiS (DUF1127 family)
MAARLSSLSLSPIRRNDRTGVIGLIRAFLAVDRQRRALERLDPHLRNDLGLTEADIEREVSRAPWDVPSHWRL